MQGYIPTPETGNVLISASNDPTHFWPNVAVCYTYLPDFIQFNYLLFFCIYLKVGFHAVQMISLTLRRMKVCKHFRTCVCFQVLEMDRVVFYINSPHNVVSGQINKVPTKPLVFRKLMHLIPSHIFTCSYADFQQPCHKLYLYHPKKPRTCNVTYVTNNVQPPKSKCVELLF